MAMVVLGAASFSPGNPETWKQLSNGSLKKHFMPFKKIPSSVSPPPTTSLSSLRKAGMPQYPGFHSSETHIPTRLRFPSRDLRGRGNPPPCRTPPAGNGTLKPMQIFSCPAAACALMSLVCTLAGVRAEAEVGESDLFYRAWQTADGLPDNSVTGVAQSSDGYLWVATEGGITRFNGADLTGISLRRFPSIRSQAARALHFDRHGQLWIAMEHGLLVRLGRHGGRTFTTQEGLLPGDAGTIAEDGAGAVWVSFPTGLCRISDNAVDRFTTVQGLPEGGNSWVGRGDRGPLWFARGGLVGIYQDSAFRVLEDFKRPRLCMAAGSAAKVWVGAGSEIFSYAIGKPMESRGRLPEGIEGSVMFEDKAGALWIGTNADGLFRLDGGSLEKVPTSNPNIECIDQDREGNIWAGTNGGGLNLIRRRAMVLTDRASGLPFDSVLSVTAEPDGTVWVVGQGGGLARESGDEWEIIRGLHAKATCVSTDAAGTVWVGTRNDGIKVYQDGAWHGFTTAEGLSGNSVRSILNASNGDVWIAMESPDRLVRLRDGKSVAMETEGGLGAIPAMAEGSDGTIWIGTENGRVLRVRGDALTAEPAIAGQTSMPVRSLYASPDGSLWIGYAGDGLGWYRNGKFNRISTSEGLLDDYISQLLPDGKGALWIAANRGLFQVDLADLLAVAKGESTWVRSRIYGRGEGLPSLQPSRGHFPSACRTADGHLLFAMRNGLVIARPEKIRENPEPPAVLLERVSLDDNLAALYGNRTTLQRAGNGQILDLSKSSAVLHVPPGHNKLKFEFAALSFASPENVHFRYRLTGFDRDWVEGDTQHSATYPRLPGGDYEFRVIASNNAGVWNNQGASLRLVVAPFFWETWWFRIGAAVAMVTMTGGAVFLGQRRRHKAQLARFKEKRAVEEERARIARDIHDDLGASLTRIMLMSRPAAQSPGTPASAAMPQIFETSRNLIRSMGEVVWAINPEQDTFDGLAGYLSNYAQDFLGLAGIRCRLDMPLKLPERSLSAQVRHTLFLAYKEALNNVVKHSGATETRISLIPGDRNLILRIEDNGCGIDSASAAGNGLANMSKRLEEIGGSCTMESSATGGSRLQFEVRSKRNP